MTSAFMHPNLKGSPITTQTNCYESMFRTVMKYAAALWDPH